jgi:uncharacterized protein YjbI with pentapeptide repeats
MTDPNEKRCTPQSPDLQTNLVAGVLPRVIEKALQQTTDIDSMRFKDADATAVSGTDLEFTGCCFEHCVFSDWSFRRVSFVDCVLENCDLSGLRLESLTFQRVKLVSCRLTGVEWLKAALMNVMMIDCAADYFTLSESKCTRVLWRNCRFRESIWQDVKLKDSVFDACDLTSSQIRYMPMAGLDMSTCKLDALQIDPLDLRGMKVTAVQALMFCSLLGLIVLD